MKGTNKTRYAILGALIDGPSSGYEIKSFMNRSTAYFWQESDSTIYPMLKLLENEKKVVSQAVYVGKKKKLIYEVTGLGREEFKIWLKNSTGQETHRNEFLLKLFFAPSQKEVNRIVQERLLQVESSYQKYKEVDERLKSATESFKRKVRHDALSFGLKSLALEKKWLKTLIN